MIERYMDVRPYSHGHLHATPMPTLDFIRVTIPDILSP